MKMTIFALKPRITKGLAVMGAFILVGAAAAGMAAMPDTKAQAQESPCAEAAGFSDLAPAVLRSQMGAAGQVVLTWYGPGVVPDLNNGQSVDAGLHLAHPKKITTRPRLTTHTKARRSAT